MEREEKSGLAGLGRENPCDLANGPGLHGASQPRYASDPRSSPARDAAPGPRSGLRAHRHQANSAMKSDVKILVVTVALLGLLGGPLRAENAPKPAVAILEAESFRHYIEDFNKNDKELYQGKFPNAA